MYARATAHEKYIQGQIKRLILLVSFGIGSRKGRNGTKMVTYQGWTVVVNNRKAPSGTSDKRSRKRLRWLKENF